MASVLDHPETAQHSPDSLASQPLADAGTRPPSADAGAGRSGRWPKSWPMMVCYAACSSLEWLFGLASLLATLAVLAAIPVVNFLVLGYLLESSGRVARTGRITAGFIDIEKFARIGSMVAGTWLALLIPRLVASLATDAWLIDPGGSSAEAWRVAQFAVTGLVLGHVLLAWYSGGRLRHFFWPLLAPFQLAAWLIFGRVIGPVVERGVRRFWPALADDLFTPRPLAAWFPPAILAAAVRRGRLYAEARDAVWEFFVSLRMPQRFWLGLRGFCGALAWLVVPSAMLMAGTSGRGPATVLVGFLGAIAMAAVLLYLPFLQMRFACHNRCMAMFEVRQIRQEFRRAPLAWWLALVVTLAFALPLYLFKIEPVLPPELRWTVTLIFILLIYPAKLVTGWAVGRSLHRQQPRWSGSCWLARLAAVPVVAAYVFVVFFTQYTSFTGPASILEHHAFLVPVPFLMY